MKKKVLGIILGLVMLGSVVLTGSARQVTVGDIHNYALVKILTQVESWPGSGAMYDVDLMYAESLYNSSDPHLLLLPASPKFNEGAILVLNCITDPRLLVPFNLNCDLITVLN